MEQAAGIFLIRKDNKLLIGHPTNGPENRWSIPKGRLEDGEYPTDAAVREMYEEANVDLKNWSILHNLDPVRYKNKDKILIPFVLFERQNKIDFDKFELKCNSNAPEEFGGHPEMDDFMWVTLYEAENLIYQSQIKCFSRIIELMSKLKYI
jgi:8-oxo-dGTP pyrophosphatase MutT (NUDIX family)